MELSEKQLSDIDNCLKIARSKGNADANPYLFGMANGIELIAAIVQKREVNYLNKFGDTDDN